jgi:hypothetical protein
MKTAVLAAVVLVAAAAPAQAADGGPSGTIVYTKDFNVFGVSADGARQRQFTTQGTAQGGYGSGSLNDAGTVVTVRGPANSAQQLDATSGQVLHVGLPHMDPGGLTPALAEVVANPAGDEIAYSYLYFSGYPYWTTDTCVGLTTVTASVQLRQWCGIFSPHWWNDKLIVSNQREIGLADPSSASGPTVILPPDGDLWWSEADVARSGSAMVAVAFDNSDTKYLDWIPLARSGTVLTPLSAGHCTVPADTPQNPTFSPDGRYFAWQNSDGVAISIAPNGVAGDGMCTFPGGQQPQLLVPGGSGPHWSAGSLPAAGTSPTTPIPSGGKPKLIALPKKAKGAKKVVSRSPKVCTVVGKHKKMKVKVLKNGRCTLKVTRGKKSKKFSFRVGL